MNRIALIAALAVVSASAAYAQQIQWVDPTVPKGMLESKGGPSGTLADPAVPQLVQDPRRGHNDADARQCLQLTTNDQIHRCAEKYRSPASRAKLVKTAQPAGQSKAADAAKSETVQPAETPKTAESAKTTPKAADTPKPAAAAKSTEPVKAASPAKSPATPKPADAAKTAK